jgi:superfamily II DNA or RNA helicase
MSRKVSIDDIPEDSRKEIMKDLTIKVEQSSYSFSSQAKYIYPFEVTEDDEFAYIPFAYGRTCPHGGPFPAPPKENFPTTKYTFDGQLRSHQTEVKSEAIKHLNKDGSTIISCYPGYGKTSIAINIASKIKLKTLVITHRIVLVKQWVAAIKKFCPEATVQILDAKTKMKDCDFYIINAINVAKRGADTYTNVGFLVVDEAHCIMSEVFSKSMLCITPRYLLGLSATPYREDGLDVFFDLFFGKNRIHRKLHRKHYAYRISTNFKPEVELSANGKINWGVLLDSQAMKQNRNEMIIKLIKHFPDRVFLVLCKRVEQGNYLVKRLKEENEDVTSLIGKQQTYEQKSRILVGTASKAGTGFDHPRLDAMILACDLEAYFIQYLGRVMRTEEVVPIIFDIVDKNPILEKHYKVRKAVYLEHGGETSDFSKKFPEFEIGV